MPPHAEVDTKTCGIRRVAGGPGVPPKILGNEAITIYGFFQSGCLITVEREVAHEKKPLPPGKYLLNTVRAGGDVKLTTQDGKTHPDIPRYSLKALIAAGLRRAD